jgi:hypothetical protein
MHVGRWTNWISWAQERNTIEVDVGCPLTYHVRLATDPSFVEGGIVPYSWLDYRLETYS